MDKLTVKTNAALRRKNDLKVIMGLFSVLTVAVVLLMHQNLKSLFLSEAILALALGWTYYRSAKNGDVTLDFEGDSLTITYSDGRKYDISEVDRNYFTLTQSPKDLSLNIGTLSVSSTNFRIMYIKEFDKVKEYINTHFEHKSKKSIYYFDDEGEED